MITYITILDCGVHRIHEVVLVLVQDQLILGWSIMKFFILVVRVFPEEFYLFPKKYEQIIRDATIIKSKF